MINYRGCLVSRYLLIQHVSFVTNEDSYVEVQEMFKINNQILTEVTFPPFTSKDNISKINTQYSCTLFYQDKQQILTI